MQNSVAPVIIKGEYKGCLRNEMTHLKSNNTIMTDAPTDNHGKGEAFSPTDLVCGALAACMMTIMGITAQTHEFDIDGATYEVKKTMAADPRRVGQIDIVFNFPRHDYTPKQQAMLKSAADTCPVAKTLSTEVVVNITMNF
jgi:uncharacterized OsmC-like protein